MPSHLGPAFLTILTNDQRVGELSKDAEGMVGFSYDEAWLARAYAPPVSISLPLREEPYTDAPVLALFANLLPDSQTHCDQIADRVGAAGADTYSLFAEIGGDCAGALHIVPGGDPSEHDLTAIEGEPLDEEGVEALLQGLSDAPLGLAPDDPFRIAVAGAQKKTALLLQDGQWFKPHRTTPTTHILKTQIGKLPTGTDLSNSVENEYYCLKLAEAFGLPVANAEIRVFGDTRTLVVERFDRKHDETGQLVRLHQEDMCQALSVHPSIKYERKGGPGVAQILKVLEGSDDPARDQEIVLKAQLLFWLTGATDGHAKNFSIFLGPGGAFRLAPLYDILTVEPSIADGSAGGLNPRLAMSVGADRQHTIAEIGARHFVETAEQAGLSGSFAKTVMEEIADEAPSAIAAVEASLNDALFEPIHEIIKSVMTQRIGKLHRSASEA
ncbi:type II toxin-antitoxin system HipA family toxin [Methyloligella solikamskensis]|uniref:Type II toxin-antitoxin system HipA family toxin n=1 Tax=Methyloligella solikamskensis TaxID=1177756 RepID=A0ABW3J795_9HYPH